MLVGWSLTSLFSTNMAISETKSLTLFPVPGTGAGVKGAMSLPQESVDG